MTAPTFCIEPSLYPSCLITNGEGEVIRFCKNHGDQCPRFHDPTEWEKAQSILLGTQSKEVCLNEFTKNTPTLIDEKDVIDTFERFCPTILSREPSENSDNYRELLPKELWEHYPSYMRAFLLDSGRLRVHELGDPQVQIDAIRYLKSKGQWSDLPLILKLAVFFGYETKETLIDAEKRVRNNIQSRFVKAMEKEGKEKEEEALERRLQEQAYEKAKRILNTPKTEQEFFKEHLNKELRKVM